MSNHTEPLVYGNWIKPVTPGLGKLGLLPTMVLFIAAVVAMVAQLVAGLFAMLIAASICLAVLAPLLVEDRDGRNKWQLWTVKFAFRRAARGGRTTYAPHLMSGLAFGAPARLPGLLAQSELLECDYRNSKFAVLSLGGKRRPLYALPIRVDPEGLQLVDSHQVDTWVANWGEAHKSFADDLDLVGLSVTLETAPDPGTAVRNSARRLIKPGAPSLARKMLEEAGDEFPGGSAESYAWVTLTWSALRDDEVLTREEMLEEIKDKLPSIVARLRSSGAGRAAPMTPAQLVERVMVAYDPDTSEAFADLRADGVDPDIPWFELGTGAHEAEDRYLHSGVASMTFRMIAPSQSPIQSKALAPMLKAHPALIRKRVTWLYRPHLSFEAANRAQKDLKTAAGKGGGTAERRRNISYTEANATAVASGHGLERFSCLVTLTIDKEAVSKSKATTIVKGMVGSAHLAMRLATYGQALGFQCGLGIGIVPTEYSALPQFVREMS